jgi:hypothetical protein
MQSTLDTERRKTKAPSKGVKIGDRVTFSGQILRVLPGDERPLLIMIDANGVKITIQDHWFENGEKLRGSDALTLAGTVTRVGESISDDFAPVSIAVDGYTATRVTIGKKWVNRAA